jgi:hypothetical protein
MDHIIGSLILDLKKNNHLKINTFLGSFRSRLVPKRLGTGLWTPRCRHFFRVGHRIYFGNWLLILG